MVSEMAGCVLLLLWAHRLNPYYAGIWSRRSLEKKRLEAQALWVLILIMLEYGLGERVKTYQPNSGKGLNPYYAGIWSRRGFCPVGIQGKTDSLNPYYAGIWSRSLMEKSAKVDWWEVVLILIMLEYGLGAQEFYDYADYVAVLILIMLEYGLGVMPL